MSTTSISDDPMQQDGQIPQTELERIIYYRVRQALLSGNVPQQMNPQPYQPGDGGWANVYRSSDPDGLRRMFDQQMTSVTGCGFVPDAPPQQQVSQSVQNPFACAGVGQSPAASSQQGNL